MSIEEVTEVEVIDAKYFDKMVDALEAVDDFVVQHLKRHIELLSKVFRPGESIDEFRGYFEGVIRYFEGDPEEVCPECGEVHD